MISSEIKGGACASLIRALVSSGKEFHVDQAVLFPCPTKAETVSHPINTWNKGSAVILWDPDRCILCGLPNIGNFCNFQMPARLHVRVIVFQLLSQLTLLHQCQQCG